MSQNAFAAGGLPIPRWGAYSAPPDLLARIGTGKNWAGKGREGKD